MAEPEQENGVGFSMQYLYVGLICVGVMIVFILIAIALIDYNNGLNDKDRSVLDDKFWLPRAQCAEFNSVFKISDDDYNCPLEPCIRLNTTSGTLVDKCVCKWNNHTVYRYCRTMLIFYDYAGGLNETNLVSIN